MTQLAMRNWTMAQPVVSAYVTSVVRDFRDRDDLIQEIAVAVLESFGSYDATRPFVGWALGVARNQIGTYLRERRRNRLVFSDKTAELLADTFSKIEPSETRALDYLQDCVAKLNAQARQICSLRYESDLKPAAIAHLVGSTPNRVAKTLQRARDQLRLCIERQASIEGTPS